jgi:hypothetical protein
MALLLLLDCLHCRGLIAGPGAPGDDASTLSSSNRVEQRSPRAKPSETRVQDASLLHSQKRRRAETLQPNPHRCPLPNSLPLLQPKQRPLKSSSTKQLRRLQLLMRRILKELVEAPMAKASSARPKRYLRHKFRT